jgi:hypothetical protein
MSYADQAAVYRLAGTMPGATAQPREKPTASPLRAHTSPKYTNFSSTPIHPAVREKIGGGSAACRQGEPAGGSNAAKEGL